MKRYAAIALAFLTASCVTALQTAQNTVGAICNEGNAINAAASSPQGLQSAAVFGTGASLVLSKVAKNNAKLQAACAGVNLLLPATSALAQQLMTSNAAVLATNAAPPALVAAARK